MVGNFWAILVTAGIGFVSFYSILVFINHNLDPEEITEEKLYNEGQKIKKIPKLDPSFLMDKKF